ncbi:hypothetical protein PAE9249_03589 [Paenibacillus sp. CECT 9249]|uniref:DUF1129 family protein n=1 Tax=Paenibacillus sp. CECT 9249 TaxID=2845385 RepID=UPI001E62A82C|nr:DUF1129 family protein [Paenibacillus sp. CECT 9249]CAH0121063.1 hypothetical protein PAE9249_03589 [Paenibacillus sp. CECT 9249]
MLSKKAERFLSDLKIYLTTYGKNEQEIEDIVSELEDHLIQAEKDGKSIEEITGGSPKAYMEQLRDEMKTDQKEVLSALLLFFPLALAFVILPDALQGNAAYTLLDVIGNLTALIIGLGMFILFLRLESSRSLAKATRIAMYWIIGFVPMGIFLGIKLLNRFMELSPVFIATPSQNYMIAAACGVFLIGYSIFAKTWITIIFPCIVIVPDFIANVLTTSPQNRAIANLGIEFGLIVVYLVYLVIQNRRKA